MISLATDDATGLSLTDSVDSLVLAMSASTPFSLGLVPDASAGGAAAAGCRGIGAEGLNPKSALRPAASSLNADVEAAEGGKEEVCAFDAAGDCALWNIESSKARPFGLLDAIIDGPALGAGSAIEAGAVATAGPCLGTDPKRASRLID